MGRWGEIADIREYIRARVDVEDRGHESPCWVWQRYRTEKGYGRLGRPVYGERRVHRITYAHFVGPIPAGLTLDHLCCVKACCNPKHLEPVTDAENRARARHAARRERAA